MKLFFIYILLLFYYQGLGTKTEFILLSAMFSLNSPYMCYYHNLFYCLSDTDNLLFYKNSQILRLNTEAIYLLSACIVDSSLITYSAFVARARTIRLRRVGISAYIEWASSRKVANK